MPSPVGHALGAVAIGWMVAGVAAPRRALAMQAGVLAALAIAPDLDLAIGRHSRETHSVGAAVIAASLAAWMQWPIAQTRARIWLTAFFAWFSHPAFDALSPDNAPPIGVMILWPFSTVHWQTGWAVFAPIWRDWTDPRFLPHDLLAILRELTIVGPIVAFVWWLRRDKRWTRVLTPSLVLLGVAALCTVRLGAQTETELRWAGDAEGGAPFVEADAQRPDRVVGMDVDMAEMVAKELGRSPRFIQITFTSLDQSAARGDFDLAFDGIEDTPARRAALPVTIPYYEFREVITVRAKDRDKFRSLADLRGHRVGTLGGTMAYELLLAAEREQGIRAVSYDDDVHPYSDLANGRVDAVLLDHVIAERTMRRVPGLVTHADAVAIGHYVGIAGSGDTAMRDRIDDILRAAMRDGRLEAILRKWNVWNDDQPHLFARLTNGGEVASAPASGVTPISPWTMTRQYIPALLSAAVITLLLSCLAMALAVMLGGAIAIGRVYGGAAIKAVLIAYVEVMRGTPILLQLFVIYYGLAEIVRLPAFAAALIGLGLNYAAYESEIYRGALEAVPRGQLEAARVLGFSDRQTLRLVRGPQAFRLALAPMTNDFVAMLKDSSLVSVLTVMELTKQTQIFATNLGSWVIPGALCAGLYLAMSLPLSHVARRLEERWKAPTAS